MGEGNLFFFPNPWHRLAHPPVVVVPKAINHLKMDMVESFPLYGGKLIKTRQMERERGKRLFSTLSQRCLNRTHAHIQNHSGDSYLLVPEFKAAEVRQPNIIAIAYSNTQPLLALSIVLS